MFSAFGIGAGTTSFGISGGLSNILTYMSDILTYISDCFSDVQ